MSSDSGPRILTADEIFAADDRTHTTVLTPEWGAGTAVRIQSLTVEEQDDYVDRATSNGEVDGRLVKANMVAASLVEPKLGPDEVSRLRKKSAAAFNRILKACLTINGLDEKDPVAAAAKTFPEERA